MLEQAILYWTCCGRPSSPWFIDRILPYAPLITASIATIAGIVAIISILVTKKIARRRAAIDFFLKTEMDQALLTLYENCQKHIKIINASITPDTKLEELVAAEGYGAVRTYLNIHELIAVGIKNKVFDAKVCYQFWSGILVGHCTAAEAIIIFSRKAPEEEAAYLQLTNLNRKWGRKIAWWRWRQSLRLPGFARHAASPTSALPSLADVDIPKASTAPLQAEESGGALVIDLAPSPIPVPSEPVVDQSPERVSEVPKSK